MLPTLTSTDFFSTFCATELQRVVFQSHFREIFFLTRFQSGPAYVPLKMLFTLARLFFFHDATLKSGRLESMELPEYVSLFAAYLRILTPEPIGFRQEDGTAEVLYGDNGFMVSEELATTVRTYQDAAWPSDATDMAPPTLPADLTALLRSIESKNTFKSPIAFPVAQEG